jgi:sec-independent protein translocase protein TatA
VPAWALLEISTLTIDTLTKETTDMGLDNPIHIAFLLILLLLVFGAKRLPEMGQSLGSGMRGFKDALSGEGSQPSLSAVQAQPQDSAIAPAAAAVPMSAVASSVAGAVSSDDSPGAA